jgi:hypothetical protein
VLGGVPARRDPLDLDSRNEGKGIDVRQNIRRLVLAVPLVLTSGAASAQVEDEYLRYELLAPATASYRMVLEFTVRAGVTHYVHDVPAGADVIEMSAIELATGTALEIVRKGGTARINLVRPVPPGVETRIRLSATFKDPRSYRREGETVVFTKADFVPRNAIVIPAGYEIAATNLAVQVIEQPDRRLTLGFMVQPPGVATPPAADPEIFVRLRPLPLSVPPATVAPGPLPPVAGPDAAAREQPMHQIRVTERALQDREIVYFLKEPETHAFALYHDYTAAREGERLYVNVVRAGSSVSDPSAKNLDTGETLQTRTLTGADIAREKIDIPDRVEPGTQVVLIPFPPVKPRTSTRLRISETYTDPARYALVDGQLMWRRSFGRPRNDMVLPPGWYLTTSSIPAVISQEPNGGVRLSFWNPRPDNIDVLVRARRR